MNSKLYTPQEIADVLKIKKATVYEMIKKDRINAVKMGKQLRISEADLNAFLNNDNKNLALLEEKNDDKSNQHSEPNFQAPIKNYENIIVCGQDIVLDMLCSVANSMLGGSKFLRSYSGSYDGLLSLYREEVQIATAHLWDMETDTYNLSYVKALLPGEQASIYHILKRPVYIYTLSGNPKGITSIKDFSRSDVSIVNRERGSGIRVLTDSLLTAEGISVFDVNGYGRIVNSHLAAASVVSRGGADCAVGIAPAALQFPNIEKVFLKYEQYDMVLRKSIEALPEIQIILKILRSEKFKEEVASLGNYDVSDIGKRLM